MYTLLIVEDDPLMQRVLRDMLRPEGFEIRICPDGLCALKAAPQDKPDLVLLDVHLPDMNGFEVCKALKADPRTKHIPVLMLTGEARETLQRVEGLDLGAEDYLFKPVGRQVLVSRIQSLLRITTRPI